MATSCPRHSAHTCSGQRKPPRYRAVIVASKLASDWMVEPGGPDQLSEPASRWRLDSVRRLHRPAHPSPDGARTTPENFWRRVLRARLPIKPRSKSPAEAGLKWLSMERLRVNGISSSL